MSRKYSFRKLTEAVHVENATHIGTAKHCDVFDILTFDAAQQFIVGDNQQQAGTAFTHDANTFNANINENQKLYFITNEDTNVVIGAVVLTPTSSQNVSIKNEDQDYTISNIGCNFMYENANFQNIIAKDVPLYLIPRLTISNVNDQGMYVVDNELKACFGQMTEETHIPEFVSTQNITHINTNAFTFGVTVETLYTRRNTLDVDILPGVTFIGYLDEDVVENEPEVEHAEEQPAEVNNVQPETAQAQADSVKNQEEVKKLKYNFIYKIVGDEAHIVRGKPGYTVYDIPEQIDGKPVTTIEAYAFYKNKTVRDISLPKTIVKIEKGAFYDLPNLHWRSRDILNRLAQDPKVIKGKDALRHDIDIN